MQQATIGNYRIVSELATGSFGRVYLAQHAVLTNRTVAVKLMQNTPLNSQEERNTFLQEARILEVLHHPFVLPIIDVGIHEGLPYIVSEYAAQGSLRRRLQQYAGQPLPLEMALAILGQVGYGLQYAHQHNIIHRDLKPENILFNARGEALLADFGLATPLASASIKLTNSAGTPLYMAPEQFQGIISRESDQYALACIAYELLTGQHVFNAPDPVALMFQHVTTAPKPLSSYNPALPPYIEAAVLKALSKQRYDRFVDVQAFLAALGILEEPISPTSALLFAQSTTPTERIRRRPAPAPTTPVLPLIPPSSPSLTPIAPSSSLPTPRHPFAASDAPASFPPTLSMGTAPVDQGSANYPVYAQHYASHFDTSDLPATQLVPPMVAEAIETYKVPNGPISTPAFGSFNSKYSIRSATGPKWPLVVLILSLVLLLVSGSAWYTFSYLTSNGQTGHGGITPTPAAPPTPTPTIPPQNSVVTITPAKQHFQTTYTLTGVPGTPTAGQNQVAASFLSYTTPAQSQTASATGTGTNPATSAAGTVTFVSNDPNPQTIPVGTSLVTCSNALSSYGAGSPCYSDYVHIMITTTQTAYIPAATSGPSYATVSAVAAPGSAGNIAANMVDDQSSTWFTTSSAFSGGQDAQTYPVVQQSDITNAENALAASQTQVAQNAILQQVPSSQQAIGKPACKSNATADHVAGDQVATFTVQASANCTLDAYDQYSALSIAEQLLVTNNAHYTFASTPTAQIVQATPQNGTITITVQAQGTGTYSFTDAQKQQFVQLIEGKSPDQAKSILQGQTGVADVLISPYTPFLPNDPTLISIVIAKA
jgi:serine/threonine protein kinase